MKYFLFTAFLFLFFTLQSQEIAILKYGGGGDWYSNPTSLPNLISFCNSNINTKINTKPQVVAPTNVEMFNYPFLYMTGHGNVFFNDEEAQNIQNYLKSGGFLHIDDNYGMDEYVRKEIAKIFPNETLKELPGDHPIFSQYFKFPGGLPKIHEHDKGRPQALGITFNGRLVLLYTYECDLGDGWENQEIHNNPEQVRLKALQMGANIIHHVFNH